MLGLLWSNSPNKVKSTPFRKRGKHILVKFNLDKTNNYFSHLAYKIGTSTSIANQIANSEYLMGHLLAMQDAEDDSMSPQQIVELFTQEVSGLGDKKAQLLVDSYLELPYIETDSAIERAMIKLIQSLSQDSPQVKWLVSKPSKWGKSPQQVIEENVIGVEGFWDAYMQHKIPYDVAMKGYWLLSEDSNERKEETSRIFTAYKTLDEHEMQHNSPFLDAPNEGFNQELLKELGIMTYTEMGWVKTKTLASIRLIYKMMIEAKSNVNEEFSKEDYDMFIDQGLMEDQAEAASKILNNRVSFLTGVAGTGKAQPSTTKIPTPNGYKKLGDIVVGDKVFDKNGQPTTVTGVFNRGKKENFKIAFGDGRVAYSNDDHIWNYTHTTGNGKGIFKNATLRELIDKGLVKKDKRYPNSLGTSKFAIPTLNQPVQYNKQPITLDPYVLGAFIGDGYTNGNQLAISGVDDFIYDLIAERMNVSVFKYSDKNYSHLFRTHGLDSHIVKPSEWLPKEAIGLAHEKHIPEAYKYNTEEIRLEILQGLFDTDGSVSVSGGRYHVRYDTVSKQLALDVQEIIESLGWSATINETDIRGVGKHKGYVLIIKIPGKDKHKLFKLPAKKDIALNAPEPRSNFNQTVIRSAESTGEFVDMICIMVDNEEHLYLTENFIVTHNTYMVNKVLNHLQNQYQETEGIDQNKDLFYMTAIAGRAVKNFIDDIDKNIKVVGATMAASVFVNARKKQLQDAKVVIIDEVSMADINNVSRTIRMAKSADKIIFIGDVAQLPAIQMDFYSKTTKDNVIEPIMLTKPKRQKADSGILSDAMLIRNGQMPLFDKPDSQLGHAQSIEEIVYQNPNARVFLVGTNRTAKIINDIKAKQFMDKALDSQKANVAYGTYADGTRFLVTKNSAETGLMNGEIITLNVEHSMASFTTEDGRKLSTIDEKKHGLKLGFAITIHKSQGSTIDNVVTILDSYNMASRSLLYTAITRASKKHVLYEMQNSILSSAINKLVEYQDYNYQQVLDMNVEGIIEE